MTDKRVHELTSIVSLAVEQLKRLDDEKTAKRQSVGKWSQKEIVGHLIDSAANNHHRLVRGQQVAKLSFPTYDQDKWVRLQQYIRRPWAELIELWHAYNLHLIHVIWTLPEKALDTVYQEGPGGSMTLDELVSHYVWHLRHHLDQLGIEQSDQPFQG